MTNLKHPRVIVFNVPDGITPENAAQATALQNSELQLNEDEIKAKFVFEDRKKHKNLLIEVNPGIRKRLVDRKLKIGWHVCNSSDSLSVTRCYKCSKYNHRAQECFGDVVCPHCAESHTVHDCKASKENYRCVNCINYNKYNTRTPVNINRSSLDKSCSCYKAALKKYSEKLDY
jgi:hypothetical protein